MVDYEELGEALQFAMNHQINLLCGETYAIAITHMGAYEEYVSTHEERGECMRVAIMRAAADLENAA